MQRNAVQSEFSGRVTTNVAGPLLPGWAGKLASVCARRAISIDRGHAVGDRNGLWSAHFEIVSALDLRALPLASSLLEDADDSARPPPAPVTGPALRSSLRGLLRADVGAA
jgi:hypothetical protein